MASRAYIKICLNSEEIANRPDMTSERLDLQKWKLINL